MVIRKRPYIGGLEILKKEPGEITLFWMRRDLRLVDNHGLYQALKKEKGVLPLFIFDQEWLEACGDKTDARVTFVHDRLMALQRDLVLLGSTLCLCYGKVKEVFKVLMDSVKIKAVYTNKDYDPKPLAQIEEVKGLLAKGEISLYRYKDHVIFEEKEVVKDDGESYVLFTPYMRKWQAIYRPEHSKPFPTADYFGHLWRGAEPFPLLSLNDLGFGRTEKFLPEAKIDRNILKRYVWGRNYPAMGGTTRIGVHLRYGTISIREAVNVGLAESESWLSQLIWREFFMMILANHPYVVDGPFRQSYAYVPWRHDEEGFKVWCEGRTGFPIVDAGMRELNQTGFMHNRVRMITASFLVKCLLIDWRWGEAYFGEQLLDHELALNNGNWQWVAGCGTDSMPSYRIFSPERQTKRFDPDHSYIRKWVPEYNTPEYPPPMLDYKEARKRTLEAYKQRFLFSTRKDYEDF